MIKWIMLFIGGGTGAVLRYSISTFAIKYFSFFPMGTLIVNLTGCFFIGFLTEIFTYRMVSSDLKVAILTGVLGALTTFSTFSLETYHLIKQNNFVLAFANIFLNLLLGLFLVIAGIVVSKLLLNR